MTIPVRAQEQDDETVLLSSNIIRNFKFESFNDILLNDSNQAYGGKLKFEMQPAWELKKENVELISKYTIGDKIYMYYKVGLTNKVNIYTNVKLNDCAERGLQTKTSTYDALTQTYYGSLDPFHVAPWYSRSNIKFEHYDFGNIKTWNSQVNNFGGNLKMSFDIDQTPLPATLTDSEGNVQTKEFSYIAVSSAGVISNTHGKMSDDMPEIIGLQPSEYKTDDLSLPAEQGDINQNYDPNILLNVMEDPINSFDEGIQYQTVGSSLNPRTKEGQPIWSAKDETSMQNCSISYNVGRISPVVFEWGGTLEYTKYDMVNCEYLDFILFVPVGSHWVQTSFNAERQFIQQPVALHCHNRYIQTEFKVEFNVYSCYRLEAEESEFDLGRPEEYYDNLTWNSAVEGFAGGHEQLTGGDWFMGDTGIITIILIIIIVAVIGYVSIKILRGRYGKQAVQVFQSGKQVR